MTVRQTTSSCRIVTLAGRQLTDVKSEWNVLRIGITDDPRTKKDAVEICRQELSERDASNNKIKPENPSKPSRVKNGSPGSNNSCNSSSNNNTINNATAIKPPTTPTINKYNNNNNIKNGYTAADAELPAPTPLHDRRHRSSFARAEEF